jgi:hypothetical protein
MSCQRRLFIALLYKLHATVTRGFIRVYSRKILYETLVDLIQRCMKHGCRIYDTVSCLSPRWLILHRLSSTQSSQSLSTPLLRLKLREFWTTHFWLPKQQMSWNPFPKPSMPLHFVVSLSITFAHALVKQYLALCSP